MSGRRRQGKTYLLRALCQAVGGFYFAADEAADAESLRGLGEAVAAHTGAAAPLSFADWHDAIDALLALGRATPVPVAIDEFPYLVRANARLPSIMQNALAPLRPEREDSRARLLLCGSAMSFMGRLLSGNAPLRGRAGLELVVPTLDHQLAAEFWGIPDPATAVKVNAIVGGTPAYRREFARDDTPASPEDFDAWVLRTVLSPASPLFREARYLLADEPELRDTSLYHSVLAAIASGNPGRGGIASYLGRKSGDLAHPLTVLEDCGLISREPDAFKDNRTRFRIAEPLVTFYHAVMRPIWTDLEHTRDPRSARRLWQRSQRRFQAAVLGPHFEHLCRTWTRHMAPDDLLADLPHRVLSGTVNDPARKASHEVDVVAYGLDDDNRQRLLAVGESKWGETMGLPHLDRLRHIRDLLTRQGRPGAETAGLLCFTAPASPKHSAPRPTRPRTSRSSPWPIFTAGRDGGTHVGARLLLTPATSHSSNADRSASSRSNSSNSPPPSKSNAMSALGRTACRSMNCVTSANGRFRSTRAPRAVRAPLDRAAVREAADHGRGGPV